MYTVFTNIHHYYLKNESVCVSVCPAMRFVMLRGMGLNLGLGIGDGPLRLKSIFRSDPIKGHPEIKLLWKCPKITKFGRKSSDQSIMHCLGQR